MVMFSLVAAHTWLDLETVAQLASGSAEVSETVSTDAVAGVVTLSTCNRVEIYAEAGSPQNVEQASKEILRTIAKTTDMPYDDVAAAFKLYRNDAAVRHLFEVGSGLKSAVVGEREIAGQVRRALSEAREAGHTTGTLTKLFETATRTAKDIGAQTALGATGRSIVSVALDLATELRAGTSVVGAQRFWKDANILLVGTGAYAGTTLAQLEARGAKNVAVHSSSGRAQQFVEDRGDWAMALGGSDVEGAFAEADVLIGVSGGERTVSATQLEKLREGATHRLTVLDLALTHDFDPAIGDLPAVDLITLESVKMAAPTEQQASITQAHQLVDKAVDEYLTEKRERTAADAIVTLRGHTMAVLEEEMARVQDRHGCTAAAEEVQLAMRRMVRQILHEPTVRARQAAANGTLEEYEAALETVFGLDVAEATKDRQHNGRTNTVAAAQLDTSEAQQRTA
ncbi:glutamyl-tRNA reductase [Enteractinococcus helveticum]|uniref:glutamyl-tRNA reductase n=1 Tax=Enteractinococcus helveticum TaxID=1837282 RepID=UPI0009ED3A46|nr:glutamyl-tRNA reductase [Enteractinococcus helveticum]